jgi:hypothetical protein
MAPYGADGRFPPCHCEASSPCLPLRGRCQRRVTPAADGRGWRRGTDKRAVEGASPYDADPRIPVGGDAQPMAGPALPPPPGEVSATVPRKAADGRGL